MSKARIETNERYERAIADLEALLDRFRIDAAYVGQVAEAAWLGQPIEEGAIEVVALLSPDQRDRLPLMASNGPFEVDEDSVEAARELDLVPITHAGEGDPVSIYVLMASNALYGNMVRCAREAEIGELTVRVVQPSDLAILFAVNDSEESKEKLRRLARTDSFDLEAFNKRLSAIGLGKAAVAE